MNLEKVCWTAGAMLVRVTREDPSDEMMSELRHGGQEGGGHLEKTVLDRGKWKSKGPELSASEVQGVECGWSGGQKTGKNEVGQFSRSHTTSRRAMERSWDFILLEMRSTWKVTHRGVIGSTFPF